MSCFRKFIGSRSQTTAQCCRDLFRGQSVLIGFQEGQFFCGPSVPQFRAWIGAILIQASQSLFGSFPFNPQMRQEFAQHRSDLCLATNIDTQTIGRRTGLTVGESSGALPQTDRSSITSLDFFQDSTVSLVLKDRDIDEGIETGLADRDGTFAVEEPREPDIESVGFIAHVGIITQNTYVVNPNDDKVGVLAMRAAGGDR